MMKNFEEMLILVWVHVRLNQAFSWDEECRSWSFSFSWSDWRWRARWRRKFCKIRLVSQPLEVDEPQQMSCEKWLLHFFSYLVLFRSKCLVVVLNNNKWFLLFFYFFFSFCWRTWLMTKLAEVKLMEVSLRLLILWSKLSWPLLTMNIVLSYVPNQ